MNATMSVGNLTIHRLVEQEGPFFDAHAFFPGLTAAMMAENRAWLQPRYIDPASGKLMLCIQSYLVRTPHHNIMIDTCVGNHKPRPTRDFWHMMNSDRYEKALAGTGLGVGDVHASARRPHRLEHAAGERPLGADLPEGQVRVC
jgi:hypothetical protein